MVDYVTDYCSCTPGKQVPVPVRLILILETPNARGSDPIKIVIDAHISKCIRVPPVTQNLSVKSQLPCSIPEAEAMLRGILISTLGLKSPYSIRSLSNINAD